ncbi:BURP domain-containing protein 3-like [Zingiber officinale]|uniref:BURP domain-containing protein 3-like n=1 Tax=Zingiber officinale TaxID=94328 RepID=UPI001C4C3ED8|nr:BURP domain-containing protein 3-like [Zingiber officinale]
MANHLIVYLFFLGLLAGLVAHPSFALASSPELYWKTTLPNTPIPSCIHDILHPPETSPGLWTSQGSEEEVVIPGLSSIYYNDATAAQLRDKSSRSLFFLEKDLFPGATFDLQFKRSIPKHADLLPRRVADALPFSSNKLPDVLALLSINPNSKEAREMSATLERCERTANARETKHCATSIESMVDFAVSALATDYVSAVSTVANSTAAEAMQRYAVEGFERMGGEGLGVFCHAEPYAYVVFHCHAVGKGMMREYAVSLKGSDGSRVEAMAVCHLDTTSWNPQHLMLQVLQVKPGSAEPVCHFLPSDHVLWTPRQQML